MKKMNHIRIVLITTLLLMVSMYLSSCRSNNSINQNTVVEISETVTTSVITSGSSSIESVSELSNTNANIQTENLDVVTINTSESEAVTDTECGEYTYSPPAAALDVEFVRDNIICRVKYKYYPKDEIAELPEYIFADINSYADEYVSSSEYDCSLERIGVYMFDINSDGLDDYIVIGKIVENDSMFYQPDIIEKLYIQDGNNGFQEVDFPASTAKYGIEDYILSTKTNGYNNFIGIGFDGFFTAVYDGNSAYSKTETFCTGDYRWEYLDNGLAKITVNANGHENEIAVAKFFYDTDRAEHMLLYSSLPDGTPSVSVPQTYGSNIFEFYVKRTDKAPENWYDWGVGPIEIKYIPADDCN